MPPPTIALPRSLDLLEPHFRCLEIGPLDRPWIPREHFDVAYLDFTDTEDLKRRYADDPGVTVPVDVDVVWAGQVPLRSAVGDRHPFDLVYASHVVEHIPDPIWWLQELSSVLTEGGIVSLVVPDKRYCFDVNRGLTGIPDLLDAYFRRLRRPDYRAVCDFNANFLTVDPAVAWADPTAYAGKVRDDVGDVDRFCLELCRKVEAGEHLDVHVNTFTPASLLGLLRSLATLELTDLVVERFYDTDPGTLQFDLALRRSRLPAGPRRIEEQHAAVERTLRAVRPDPAPAASPSAPVVPAAPAIELSPRERALVEGKRRLVGRLRSLRRPRR